MGIETVSAGERMWLNLVNMQAQKALHSMRTTQEDGKFGTLISHAGDSGSESGNATVFDVAISQHMISPVDKNGDGDVSRDEYHTSLNQARELLLELNSHNAMMRAFEAQYNSAVIQMENDEMIASA